MNDAERINNINLLNDRLVNLLDRPFLNRNKIKITKAKIQAIVEGGHDVTLTTITQNQVTEKKIDKNNYGTYAVQINGIYDMYKGRADYGTELLQALVYTMSVFLAGEGISSFSKNPKTQAFLDKFIKKNKLHSYGILEKVTTGLLEGKSLLVLNPVIKREKEGSVEYFKKESYIKLTSFPWYQNHYELVFNEEDNTEIEKVKYKTDDGQDEKIIDYSKAVFVKLGGTETEFNETTNRLHCCLTQIENFSRAGFDLRNNSHLFGKVFPNFKFDSNDLSASKDMEALKKELNTGNFKPGKSYVGKALFSLITPQTGAQDILTADMVTNLRIISMNTGIPIFMLSWPDLMSNRAVAEVLLEEVNTSTRKERLVWEDCMHEAIEKAMYMSVDAEIDDNDIIDEFYVHLPLMTLFMLEMIIKVWQPLFDSGLISMDTLRNKIPGIHPNDEKILIEKEQLEKIKNSPFNDVPHKDITENDDKEEIDE